jgi:PAS domain S-box-containing protein
VKFINNTKALNLGQYFYRLAEQSQDVFWIRDVDYKTLLYLSPAGETIWGFSGEGLDKASEHLFASVHPDDLIRFWSNINQIKHNLKEGQNYTQEYKIIRPGGQVRNIQEISFPLYDANHQLTGFAGITKDMTWQKQHMAELEQAGYFFRYFAERTRSVFWVRDNSCDNQVYLSPGYEKVWGRSRDSLYDSPNSWLETLHPDDRERASNIARLQTLNEMGKEAEYEYHYRIYTPEGAIRWIKDTSFPIHDEQNRFIGFAGIAEDVTNEVLHEKELREAKQRAEVANQAKSDFLAMISHEVRTPLNAILGMAQILKIKNLSEEQFEYVDIISNAGNSLLSLVGDVLDFVRLEAGKLSFSKEPFDLQELVMETIQSLQYQAQKKSLTLKFEYPAKESHKVMGDANRVRQILVNLITNAIKFTDVGSVTVILDFLKPVDNEKLFKVTVIDTGIGISKYKIDSIFEKFNQIDSIYNRKHGGIGLGLTITKQLVEAMKGEIRVKSEFGKGTEFCFTLQLEAQSETQETTSKFNSKINFSSKPKFNLNILVVEDNPINQKIIKIMLEELGCHVDVFDSGREVLEEIKSLVKFDLIFMDVGLPDISGFEIVELLRKESFLKAIPIIAVTAHVLERDRQRAFDVGIDKIVAKPINYDELVNVLKQYSS